MCQKHRYRAANSFYVPSAALELAAWRRGSGVDERSKRGEGGPSFKCGHDHLRDCSQRCSTHDHTSTAVTHSPIRSTTVAMAPTPKKDKYSVLLPTYNERRNLPIITWLLNKTFTEKYVVPVSLSLPSPDTHTLPLATLTGNLSSSMTAHPTVRKKSPHSSKKRIPLPRSRSARAPASLVSEPPTSTVCNSQPATMSSSWTPTSRTTPSSSRT
jgi:hypothetical protein